MNVKGIIRQLNKAGVADDVLDTIGLQYKGSGFLRLIGGLGVFAAGVLVGSSLGLLLAPVPGTEMREKARLRINEMREKASRMGQSGTQEGIRP